MVTTINEQINKKCLNCGVTFSKPYKFSKTQWDRTHYCSLKCGAIVNGKKKLGVPQKEEHRQKISQSLKKVEHTKEWNLKISQANKGKKKSAEFCKKLSDRMKGKPSNNKGLTGSNLGRKLSDVWKERISAGIKLHYDKKGPRKTPQNKLIRQGLEYKLWREAVFKRDNWTCIWCGIRGGVLNADHIKSFAHYPELRFAIDNGRTLCRECHLTTETWGNRNKI